MFPFSLALSDKWNGDFGQPGLFANITANKTHTILDWVYANDTNDYKLDERGQNGVMAFGKVINNFVDPAYHIMADVLADMQNKQYRFIILLYTIIVPVLFTFIILLGLLGNLLVIYVIFSHAYMRTYTHVLLMNLAIADVSFLVCCVPFQALKYAKISWQLGDISCKLIQYIIYVTLYVTIWTLVSIAIVRYYVVVRSKRKIKHTRTRPMIIYTSALWIFMAIINIPAAILHEAKTYELYTYCSMNTRFEKPLIMTLFAFGYVIPLVIILFAYSSVLTYLLRQETGTRRRTRGLHASKGIITVVICFLIAWLPYHIQSLISVSASIPKGLNYEIFDVIGHVLAYSNSVVNPIIYNYVCKDFRNAFRQALMCKKHGCIGSASLSSHSSTSPMSLRTLITPRSEA